MLEIWGGVECTVNRVGDRYFDQLEWNGHGERMRKDLARFAGLGLRTLRFSAHWERTEAAEGVFDWRCVDERMQALREVEIRPVIGLLHHGSGPSWTNLLDPAFAEKFARFARAFAHRFPQVELYTPINEPLTTARFSALYGHWYPHARDDRSFVRALLNELRATTLAMAEIRRSNPNAVLVQTEDIGRTQATPLLAYQAEFENERRFLTYDLLRGVAPNHLPLVRYLADCGVASKDFEFFAERAEHTMIAGVNHYVTSERYLDEELSKYPVHYHGGNAEHAYADIEISRVARKQHGWAGILRDVHERTGSPIVLTEVHLGSTSDEQVRWLVAAHKAAVEAIAAGVDVRALAVWSLLGAYNWRSLVVRDESFYEPGVYDLRGGTPRPTALAQATAALARGERYDHPVLDSPGWWTRPERVLYGTPAAPATGAVAARASRELLICGAGTLGREFAAACEMRALPYRLLTRSQLDIADRACVVATLNRLQPWAIINAAGFVRVDAAEDQFEACLRSNALGPATLAAASSERGMPFVTFSSDLVFDGRMHRPYLERDVIGPLNMYGHSKAAAEASVLFANPASLIVRTGAFFGHDSANFVKDVIDRARRGERVLAAGDVTVSPTYVPDLANAVLDLLIDGAAGVWHMCNQGALTWASLAERALVATGMESEVEAVPMTELTQVPRPLYSALGSERATLLPFLDDALARFASIERAA